MSAPRVLIIGGGLAGMVVANELGKRGSSVRILEASHRLGGKCGAAPNPTDPKRCDDHGYHIFPAWYVNTRALLREVGSEGHLIAFDYVNFLQPRSGSTKPRLFRLWAPSPRFVWRNITSGLLPWYEIVLGMFGALDLATQRFDEKAFLDRVSANGFLRSRFYATEGVSKAHHGFVLQASAIPHYLLSAMTASQLLASYFRTPRPIHAMLDDNLDRTFIQPLRQRLDAHRVRIDTQHCVTHIRVTAGRVTSLELAGRDPIEVGENDLVLLATPPDVTSRFAEDEVAAAESRPNPDPDDKRLSELVHLQSVPMAGWHVYFTRRLPNIPREHTVLHSSFHETSFIDISQHWPGLDVTVLSLISSNANPLRHVSKQRAIDTLVDELHDYIEFADADVDKQRTHATLHFEEELFLNTVGAWTFRPNTKTRVDNLYIAGDYCRSQADLTSMESTVQSALRTAGHMAATLGYPAAQRPAPRCIPKHPRWYMALLWYILLPAVVPVWLWARFKDQSPTAGPERPLCVDSERASAGD
jgi:uncharacterized protein with NAD-binding domain and iron-sulfur cluster